LQSKHLFAQAFKRDDKEMNQKYNISKHSMLSFDLDRKEITSKTAIKQI